jgi:hypothetical protein
MDAKVGSRWIHVESGVTHQIVGVFGIEVATWSLPTPEGGWSFLGTRGQFFKEFKPL